jgi:hypothetical protein
MRVCWAFEEVGQPYGVRLVSTTALKAMCERVGSIHVRTYIASGDVVIGAASGMRWPNTRPNSGGYGMMQAARRMRWRV